MIVEQLELIDVRNYRSGSFALTAGTTVVRGDNGHGKTNLAEALAFLATLSSFRGVPIDALVRSGAERGIIRATVVDDDGRRSLIEAEIVSGGRNRVQVNRQRLPRTRDLLGTIRVTVFSPDDLVMVKGGPADRRRVLDDTLVALATKYDAMRLELDRVVKQRNTLLKSWSASPGRSSPGDAAATLDVWDQRLVDVGERLGRARAMLVERLVPMVGAAYSDLAGRPTEIGLTYRPRWLEEGLGNALLEARDTDRRRGVTTVGPHRDDLGLTIGELPARTHASQGEQRTLALSIRLAAHRLIAERVGSVPVLVLDDVLSELDYGRAASLLANLPPGQIVITTAVPMPPGVRADRELHVEGGRVSESNP